jgi:hypothetical protein
MKLEEVNSTCSCDLMKNASYKYSLMIYEYIKSNANQKAEILKLQKEVQELKDYIKYTL